MFSQVFPVHGGVGISGPMSFPGGDISDPKSFLVGSYTHVVRC